MVNLVLLTVVGVGQVQFPATQNASDDANVLDDYEEGSWTPTDTSGAALVFTTPAAGSNRYVKVGRLVMANGSVTYPATADGSNAQIGDLPFTVDDGYYVAAMSAGSGNVFSASVRTASTNLIPVTAAGAPVTNASLSTQSVFFTALYQASA